MIRKQEITKEKAIELYESNFWENLSDYEIAKFQLFTDKLCMPFEVFHKSISTVLNRPVYTHEFGLNYDGLVKEFLGEKEKPSLEEIINLIPENKRIIICQTN